MGWRRHGSTLVLITLSIGIIALLSARLLEGGHHDDHHGEGEHSASEKKEHHGEKHASKGENAEKHASKEEKSEHGSDDEHAEESHLMAEVIGIGGGLVLMAGHLLNLGAMRTRRREDCATEC